MRVSKSSTAERFAFFFAGAFLGTSLLYLTSLAIEKRFQKLSSLSDPDQNSKKRHLDQEDADPLRQGQASKDSDEGQANQTVPKPGDGVPHSSDGEEQEEEEFEKVELLLHNVSHKDMVLSLREQGSYKEQVEMILARPKFSLFHPVSKAIHERIKEIQQKDASALQTIYCQAYSRLSDGDGGGGAAGGGASPMPVPGGRRLPAGFALGDAPPLPAGGQVSGGGGGRGYGGGGGVPVGDPGDLRFRRDQGRLLEGKQAEIAGVYFPLLAVLAPRWLRAASASPRCRKVIVLISGVGRPRNRLHSTDSNSTAATAALLEAFLRAAYPAVRVLRAHSRTNLFRYDENILFVRRELLPRVDRLRSSLAARYREGWADRLHLTLSFADGSPARVNAIGAALRPYRPTYMHIWALKTFWHETKVCEDDVEILDFDDVDTVAPEPISEASGAVRLVVAEMARFRREFERVAALGEGTQSASSSSAAAAAAARPSPFSPAAAPPLPGGGGGGGGGTAAAAASVPAPAPLAAPRAAGHDLSAFWLRKTRKPVLAVLLVAKPGRAPKVYRGTNMEVSMPTGSLCAERNVIGTALAEDLTLKREDLKMIAVLSVTLGGGDNKQASARKFSHCSASTFGSPVASPKLLQRCASNLDLNSSCSSLLGSPVKAIPPLLKAASLNERNGSSAKASLFGTDDSATEEHAATCCNGVGRGPNSAAQPFSCLPPPAQSPIKDASSILRSASTGSLESLHEEKMMISMDLSHDGSTDGTQGKHNSANCEEKGPLRKRSANIRKLTLTKDNEPKSEKMTVFKAEMNPLKPCGACNEWLKKIAEVNPDFKVITFTDSNCTGMYIEPIYQT